MIPSEHHKLFRIIQLQRCQIDECLDREHPPVDVIPKEEELLLRNIPSHFKHLQKIIILAV